MSPWKANCCSASQEIPHILRNLRVQYHVPRSLRLLLILCSKRSVQVQGFGKSFIPSFCGEESAPHQMPKLEDHPLSALCYCLFSVFAAIFCRPSHPSTTYVNPFIMMREVHLSWLQLRVQVDLHFSMLVTVTWKCYLMAELMGRNEHMVFCGNADTTYLLL